MEDLFAANPRNLKLPTTGPALLSPYPAVAYLWTSQRRSDSFLWSVQRKGEMTDAKRSEVLQGTLDLMILKTLHALGPQHGFGIARRIEQVSRDVLQLNEIGRAHV